MSGLDPQKIVDNCEVAINFCFQNVFDSLSADAKEVAAVYALLPGAHSPSVIQEVTGKEAIEVERAIAVLRKYALIERASANNYENDLIMKPMARQFITPLNKSYVSSEEIIKRYRGLAGLLQKERSIQNFNRYSLRHFTVRSKSEAITVKQLREAMRFADQGRFEEAENIISQQKVLNSSYFEIYRVAAYIAYRRDDIADAKELYGRAIETDPKQPQLYYWLGGFLLRAFSDYDAAAEQFRQAIERDPECPLLYREAARNYMYMSNFEEAKKHILLAKDAGDIPFHERLKLIDLEAQTHYRKAEQSLHAGDLEGCIKSLLDLMEYVKSVIQKRIDIDATFIAHVSKSEAVLDAAVNRSNTLFQRSDNRLSLFQEWLENFKEEYLFHASDVKEKPLRLVALSPS